MILKYGYRAFLWRLRVLPLLLLHLSRRARILLCLIAYLVGTWGLWFSYPLLGNAATMVMPIIVFCWLFSYRGLLLSFFSTMSALWIIYHYLSGDILTIGAILDRTTIGIVINFLLGLTICWLREALDLLFVARKRALTAEQERVVAVEREQQVTLAYEQQRQLNAIKDQFLLNVSHELRTPVTVLGTSLELLKDFSEQLQPVEREQTLSQALASQEALADLINRVLDTTTVMSKTLLVKPEAIGIYHVLQDVLARLAPRDVEAYTICLNVPQQLMVWADPLLLRQVLQNLFSNIFKYVPRQTKVEVEISQVTPSSPVYLSIQDAGPGIPPEELPLLFEKFVRLKRDLAGSRPGMGLGLYICKQFVEAMKGCIWAESSGRSGEGCRFCMTLPPSAFPDALCPG